jgi:hypothetical protein
MLEARNSDDRESKLSNVVDTALQFVPLPSNGTSNGAGSSCSGSASVSPPSFDGAGGSFSGAGASDSWIDCGTESATALTNSASGAAETVGSVVIDAISGLMPF